MIVSGLVVTVVAWALLWCIGEATARVLFGARAHRVATATRLPLGLAVSLCLLETLGYVLPIRQAVWLLAPIAAFGAVLVTRNLRGRSHPRHEAVLAASLAGLLVGLVPVLIAGRFTAAALTNNDGTYYLTVADWLRNVPWSLSLAEDHRDVPPAFCLVHGVIHMWDWRTGTPNLMAAVSSSSGIDSPAALAVVTALLFAAVPCAAIAIARGLGVQRRAHELVVGILAAGSAAPVFLGYQHMTGHLGAISLFPLICAALLGTARHGGLRRMLHAALLLGAGVALFADGAAALLAIAAAVVVASGRRLPRALLRVTATAFVTALVAPCTLLRAGSAAYRTLHYRLPRPEPVFPQRGWLPRNLLDDLATFVGVDPWPPWPGAWPPRLETVVTWSGAIAGLALLGVGLAALRRAHRAVQVVAGLLATLALLAVASLDVDYLAGKVLLTAAAFSVPVCAVGATLLLRQRRPARWLIAPFALAELVALGQLVSPSRWKVVDRPAHDALVPALARLPAGSLIAFDGLGAPADEVLDVHRAHRAALLADLRPVHPGLDGGFYRPLWCEDTPRPEPLPPRGYALQRLTSEHLTRGRELARWDGFRLVLVDFTNPQGLIASWAPTHSWLTAEREPDGRVFRWAEQRASGTLRIVTPAPCARLRGELRVVSGTAVSEITIQKQVVHKARISADWSPFVTRPFSTAPPLDVAFATQTSAPLPDAAHALAVRKLVAEPAWRCGTLFRIGATGQAATLPMDIVDSLEITVEPPAATACVEIVATVSGERGATFRASIDDQAPSLHYMVSPTERASLRLVEAVRPIRLTLSAAPSEARSRWQLTDISVLPRECGAQERQ